MRFQIVSDFQPTGDQPQAIKKIVSNLKAGLKEQVLLGVTGSGKTFTIANVIAQTQLPTLVISHNKTLAAQLYQEFKSFFPQNAVSYFVSYYDYYQPEAYIPQTDTYIEKETKINEEIDKLRLAATTNILTRSDTITVASVSCIYNIGSPKEYGSFILELKSGVKIKREQIIKRLTELQYQRNDYGFHRSTFRVVGGRIDVFPAYEDAAIKIEMLGDQISRLAKFDPLTGQNIAHLSVLVLYPAKHYLTDPMKNSAVFRQIEADLEERLKYFKKHQKLVEAQRLKQKVHFDLEMISTIGYVNGIENYSRYFDGRKPGEAPFTLFDYYQQRFAHKWLLIIDESHMTIPQIRGMYHGDRSRKQILIDYGFRLPAALDNRPLNFREFLHRLPQTIYVSATPSQWELSRALESAKNLHLAKSMPQERGVVEQLIRPTGLLDPQINIRPVTNQVADVIKEVTTRIAKGERVLITTLTKRMAEDLSSFMEDKGFKVNYLHADVETLDRSEILAKLREGDYDVIVGINLLREGLDLPEVSLVAILDADKEGFLRSQVSLIQTMGRAARHVSGTVIIYADKITQSIKKAVVEVERRRRYQQEYNQKHGITPKSISKPFRERLVEPETISVDASLEKYYTQLDSLTPADKKDLIKKLKKDMNLYAREMNFELAAKARDLIFLLNKDLAS